MRPHLHPSFPSRSPICGLHLSVLDLRESSTQPFVTASASTSAELQEIVACVSLRVSPLGTLQPSVPRLTLDVLPSRRPSQHASDFSIHVGTWACMLVVEKPSCMYRDCASNVGLETSRMTPLAPTVPSSLISLTYWQTCHATAVMMLT